MKILPLRTMQLDGRHVEEGVPTTVGADEARLAIMRGWAVEVERAAAEAQSESRPAAKAGAVSKARERKD